MIMASKFTEPKEVEIDVKISGRDNLKDLADKFSRLLDFQADHFYFYACNATSIKPID
jgi:hypothetical protein